MNTCPILNAYQDGAAKLPVTSVTTLLRPAIGSTSVTQWWDIIIVIIIIIIIINSDEGQKSPCWFLLLWARGLQIL
jgi:hypothetical protein